MTPALPVVYRVYGRDDVLLYVGATRQLRRRLNQHAFDSRWWTLARRVTFQEYPSVIEAFAAELVAIRTERPLANEVGRRSKAANTSPPPLVVERHPVPVGAPA